MAQMFGAQQSARNRQDWGVTIRSALPSRAQGDSRTSRLKIFAIAQQLSGVTTPKSRCRDYAGSNPAGTRYFQLRIVKDGPFSLVDEKLNIK